VARFVLGCITCTVHMARRFNHFSLNHQQCTKWYNMVAFNNYN